MASPSASSFGPRSDSMSESSRTVRYVSKAAGNGNLRWRSSELSRVDNDNEGSSEASDTDGEDSQSVSERGFGNTRKEHVAVHETQPLIDGSCKDGLPSKVKQGIGLCSTDALKKIEERRLSRVAAAFLMDYEAARAPTLPPDSDLVQNTHLFLHRVRFSITWNVVMSVAIACLFVASGFERGDRTNDQESYRREALLLVLTFLPVLVFSSDMLMMGYLFGSKTNVLQNTQYEGPSPSLRFSAGSLPDEGGSTIQAFCLDEPLTHPVRARKSRSRWWALPLTLFLMALSIETLVAVMTCDTPQKRFWVFSIFKPIVLFYASPKARNALDAMKRVSRTVFRVLLIELFLIFTFAAVACQLYGDSYESFNGLPASFISMFKLSTTVVNPSLWMPVYADRASAAVFFVSFLITSVFLLHSLVLSSVFQSYVFGGLRVIHEHQSSDREETLRLAFQTLFRMEGGQKEGHSGEVVISTKSIRNCLTFLRPHYGRSKIHTLVCIVDPMRTGFIDYNTFRAKIRHVINTSVKSTRRYNALSIGLQACAVFVALSNLCYVVLASSNFYSEWWRKYEVAIGGTISILGIAELLLRLLPVKVYRLAETAEPNITFDGLASVAGLVSITGLLFGFDYKSSVDLLIIGRAIDMVRCLRLTKEARDIIKRSGEVLPALVGPLVLLVSMMHVLCYLGMAMWGGAIEVGANSDLEPFYDRNNFNDYSSGILTIFQTLVVNDWHAIAEVFFLPPGVNNTNIFVYPFFVGANLLCVSVLLNLLISFFVGAFVTKEEKMSVPEEARKASTSSAGVSVASSILSNGMPKRLEHLGDESDESARSIDVTVSERQGFDAIMRTVAGEDGDDEDNAQKVNQLLALYESLTPDREKVGYLVSCQKAMTRYGNKRFQALVLRYMDDQTMHRLVEDMHTSLILVPDVHGSKIRKSFPSRDGLSDESLELVASLIEKDSSVAVFIARTIT